MDLENWEGVFRSRQFASDSDGASFDPSHDLAHFQRVSVAAWRLAREEGADLNVVIPAAWLHDFVNVPKNDPRRSQASRLSALAAAKYLAQVGYPQEFFAPIGHAIEAHSFSAEIAPTTLEAKVVQDADRLDALGAIGIARCFATGVVMGARFYEPTDPFASGRPLDDRRYSVDHFYVKLLGLADSLKTQAGQAEGHRRVRYMKGFLAQLGDELGILK